MKKQGKRKYDRDVVVAELCERLSRGEPMASICRSEGMPDVNTINMWRDTDAEINSRVAHARDLGFDHLAADCLHIADDNGLDTRVNDAGVTVVDRDHIQRAKLRIETRLKLLACWDPRRYGNKVDVTSGGETIPAPIIQLAYPKQNDDASNEMP
jgi:hypothetical protein